MGLSQGAAKAGDIRNSSWIPGWESSPGGGNGNPLQYSCWEIPWTEEPGGPRSIGLHSRTQLKWLSTRHTCRRGRTRLRLRLSAHVRTVWSLRPLRPCCVRGLPAVFPGPALAAALHVCWFFRLRPVEEHKHFAFSERDLQGVCEYLTS